MGLIKKLAKIFKTPEIPKTDLEVDIYPCTVIMDRYGGTYSGGLWVALNEDYHKIPMTGPDGSDMDCMNFWEEYPRPYGKGETPGEAIKDLKKKLLETRNISRKEVLERLKNHEVILETMTSMRLIPIDTIEDDRVDVLQVTAKTRELRFANLPIDILHKNIQEGLKYFGPRPKADALTDYKHIFEVLKQLKNGEQRPMATRVSETSKDGTGDSNTRIDTKE